MARASSLRSESLHAEIRSNYRAKYQALKAKFDAAATNTDNMRHWANADGLSAEAAASPEVRRTLRNRSRYECQESNAYGKGIVLKHAAHIVGRVPRLQLQTPDKAFNKFVERHFRRWAQAVKLGAKLRTLAASKTVDGEAFAKLIDNPKVNHGVKLDLRLIEADQIATPLLSPLTDNYVDGIKFDALGNVVHYDLLPVHPGSTAIVGRPFALEPIPVAPELMLHWFREDRPNQKRGLPETTPSLPLFAQLRRFTMATIAAAETAAEYAGILKTQGVPEDGAAEVDPLEAIELEMRSLLSLPAGWDISQIKAEHPTTTFEMFERAILTQIAQSIVMPNNIASGDSSKHNFASGRLDHKLYQAAIGIERYDLECGVLLQLFAAWYREFKLWAATAGLWAGALPAFDALDFVWFFDQADYSVDLNREASGTEKLFAIGAYGHPEYYANNGGDWSDEMDKNAEAWGCTPAEYRTLICLRTFGAVPKRNEDLLAIVTQAPQDQANDGTGDGSTADGGSDAREAA